MSLISRFISEQGKILSRLVNRLTLKQQRFITIAIRAFPCVNPRELDESIRLHFLLLLLYWKLLHVLLDVKQ
ncbi:hypothetical protein K2173_004475 [Erythroxylum novogranatense]|uniref:Small ribosomal subunit protein bS18c n=1 Tax=Erythroxylum novogranatense TaxID=1862640 RepID=A0AAV8T6I7_9ROSI|nr:hypothetical protein K2173_004475 [Erythroxylum novogranatense]